ncbi:MAG: hypothetical protein FWE88_07910 [Phycisphaerae bacterium]|nr:hypothetical protein [Phycisphaerae bacterium]
MNQLKIGLVCIGVGLSIAGVRELMLSANASSMPQTISCRQLAERGYDENAHVVLTDAVCVTAWMVYKGKGVKGPWEHVYFPVIAEDDPWVEEAMAADQAGQKVRTTPQNIRVLLKFKNVKNENELDSRLTVQYRKHGGIHGTIINDIDSLDAREKTLLRQGYRDLDVDNVWILEVDRAPSATKALALTGGGVAGVVLGGLWILWPYLRPRQTVPTIESVQAELSPHNPDAHNDFAWPGRNAEPRAQRERDEAQLAQFRRGEEQIIR